MANQEPTYSPAFKAKVALEALAQNKKNLELLSDTYEVPVSVILTWADQLERNAAAVYTVSSVPVDIEVEKNTIVDVEIADKEVKESINVGVMGDKLNYKRLGFWSVLGVLFVVIFSQLLKEMYDQTTMVNQERVSASSQYEVAKQKEKNRERLSTFGVVDIEKGIYRMPIDSVINEMVVDGR